MGTKSRVRERVLAIYRRHYGVGAPGEDVLAIDPNSFDKDPAAFYEDIEDAFPAADLEDALMNGGTLAELVAAIEASARPPKKARSSKDWFDVYLGDLRARAGRKTTSENDRVYTILNFRDRHGASGRRGLLAQAETLRTAGDLQPLVEQAQARKLSLKARDIEDVLDKILVYGVEYPPAYPPT